MFNDPYFHDPFRHLYPETNFHELNASWMLKTLSEIEVPEGSGCDCDLESIRKAIEKLQEADKLIIANLVLMQAEIDELRIPVMQKKNFTAEFNGIDFNMFAKTFERSAL